ncbi:MAG: anti-sigma factor domain-containing protein [Solirubrobacterales bacterium]
MSRESGMHEERRDDIAAYTLGALEPAETADIEAHLAGCDACAEYLRWLQPAVDLLPAGVEQMRPPETLRANLMDAVRADRRTEAFGGRPAQAKRRLFGLGGLSLRPALAFAAVAVAVLAGGAAVGYLVSDSDRVVSDSDGGQRDFIEAKAVGTAPAGTLAATLEHGAGGDAILHVQRAPALAPGNVYQAWVSRGDAMEPVSSFRLRDDGTADAALGDGLGGAEAVLVTEEPTPDSPQPTSLPILRANLK